MNKKIKNFLEQKEIEHQIIGEFLIINSYDLSSLIVFLSMESIKYSYCDLFDFFNNNKSWQGIKSFEFFKKQEGWKTKLVFSFENQTTKG